MCMQQKDKQVVCMLSSFNPDENVIMKCYYYEVIISLVINAYNNMLGGWIGQIKRHIHTQFNKKDLKYGMCIYYTKG